MEEKLTLAKKIILARTEQSLTQKDLAKKLRVEQGAISQWENGISTPSLKTIIKGEEIKHLPDKDQELIKNVYPTKINF